MKIVAINMKDNVITVEYKNGITTLVYYAPDTLLKTLVELHDNLGADISDWKEKVYDGRSI